MQVQQELTSLTERRRSYQRTAGKEAAPHSEAGMKFPQDPTLVGDTEGVSVYPRTPPKEDPMGDKWGDWTPCERVVTRFP